MSHPCQTCKGTGKIGPVHINWGDRPHEWRATMPCFYCAGTGEWSDERLAAYERGQAMRAERIARGESVREAARREGVSAADISRRERGEA